MSARGAVVSIAARYTLAAACIAAAALLRVSPLGWFLYPTELFILGVVAAAWFGGAGSGVFAALLSAVAIPQLTALAQLPPAEYRLLWGFFDLPHSIVLGVTGASVGWAAGSLRQAHATLRKARDELESAVAERTADVTASEERYARALEATEAGHWEWDLVTQQVFHSPRFRELYGVSPDEKFANRDAWKARQPVSESERARQEAALNASIADPEKPYDMELSFEVCPGEVRWLRSRGKVFRDENGRPLRITGATTDITTQKLAQEARRRSEERFALAVVASNDGIFEWDLVTDEQYFSERAQRILGYEPGPTVRPRKTWHLLREVHPDDEPEIEESLARHLAGATQVYAGEWRMRPMGGDYRWIHVRGVCVRDATGKPIRWVGSITDINERKLAEEALRRSEERFALAVAATNDGIFDWDFATDEQFFSERAQQILGIEPGPTVRPRTSWQRLREFHPDDEASAQEVAARILAGKSPSYEGEYRLRPMGGQYRWVQTRGVCVRDAAGKPIRMVGSLTDINERKLAEEALRRSEALLLEGQRLSQMGNFWWQVREGGISWTEQIYRIFEFEPGLPITLERIATRVHHDDLPMMRDMVERALQAVDDFEYEHRLRMPDGRIKHVHLIAHRVQGGAERLEYVGTVQDITVRKLSEESVRVSEERYSLAMEAAQDAHWDWIIDTDQYYTSPRVVDVFGLPPGTTFTSRQDYLAKTPLVKEDLEMWLRAARELFVGTGSRLNMDLRAIIKGEVRWIEHHGVVFRDASGRAVRWCGTVRDTTERRRAGEALQLSEERYALAMEASEEGHFDWDVATDEIFASERLKKLLELPPGFDYRTRHDMVSRMPFSPGDRERVSEMAREALASTALVHEFDYRLQGSEAKEPRWIHARWKIFRDASGAARRVIGVVNDVTERRKVEDDLRSRQEMLDLAQKSARAIAFEWRIGDAGEGENRWSPDLEAMYGLEPGTYDGAFETWKGLVHPTDWPRVREAIKDAERTGELATDYRVFHRDTSVHWLQARGRMFFDALAKPARVVGFMQDVTQAKQAEQDLQYLEEKLRRAQRLESMGTLAGGIAHDFNNILGAILGYGEMALRETKKGGRLRRDLDAIVAAGERGRALVDRILAFSRSGVGERVPVHVEEVVREALDQLAAKLPANVTVAPRLRAGRAAMLGDSTQVHQVVMNVVNNAVQAMPEGGVVRVSLEVRKLPGARTATIGNIGEGEYLVLRVTDAGTGIPPEVLERIFDPFFTTKEVGVGSGLGLSLVHGIVANVGGAIDVATKLGKGSSFTVYFPRSGEAPDVPAQDSQPLPRGDGQRVLVVDDEAPLVQLATETLARLGYAPTGFTSSTAALAAFRADPQGFDAVLTDERMPGLSGSALIREVRGIRDGIPVVLMSGYLGMRNVDANMVVRKPLSARDLAASMARVLTP